MRVGIIAEKAYTKPYVKLLRAAGYAVDLLGGGEGRGVSIKPSLNALICLPSCCSHGSTAKANVVKREGKIPVVFAKSAHSALSELIIACPIEEKAEEEGPIKLLLGELGFFFPEMGAHHTTALSLFARIHLDKKLEYSTLLEKLRAAFRTSTPEFRDLIQSGRYPVTHFYSDGKTVRVISLEPFNEQQSVAFVQLTGLQRTNMKPNTSSLSEVQYLMMRGFLPGQATRHQFMAGLWAEQGGLWSGTLPEARDRCERLARDSIIPLPNRRFAVRRMSGKLQYARAKNPRRSDRGLAADEALNPEWFDWLPHEDGSAPAVSVSAVSTRPATIIEGNFRAYPSRAKKAENADSWDLFRWSVKCKGKHFATLPQGTTRADTIAKIRAFSAGEEPKASPKKVPKPKVPFRKKKEVSQMDDFIDSIRLVQEYGKALGIVSINISEDGQVSFRKKKVVVTYEDGSLSL